MQAHTAQILLGTHPPVEGKGLLLFGEGTSKLQTFGAREVETGKRIIVADNKILAHGKCILAQGVGDMKRDIIDTGSGGRDIRRLLVSSKDTTAIAEFPLPRDRTVAAVIDKLNTLSQLDSRGREVEAGSRGRCTHSNLLSDAVGAIGIGNGEGNRECSDGGIQSRGIGSAKLFHLSPRHAPVIGTAYPFATIDEAETVTCRQRIIQHIEGSHRGFALLHCHFLFCRQGTAVSVSGSASNIVRSRFRERQCYGLAVGHWPLAIGRWLLAFC